MPTDQPLSVGAVVLDPARRRVTVDGSRGAVDRDRVRPARAPAAPARAGVSREQLLSEVWGYAAAAGTRTVDVHMAQVRAKLGAASPIRTVRGVGYAAEETGRGVGE